MATFFRPDWPFKVINRQAKFDFKNCSKEISLLYPAKKWWQNAALLQICHNLSVRYNNSRFGRYLRYNRLDSLPARLLSKLFLRQALAPRNVPVFSKTVSRSYYCLDLSIFANYFVIILVVWLSLSLFAHLIGVLVWIVCLFLGNRGRKKGWYHPTYYPGWWVVLPFRPLLGNKVDLFHRLIHLST
jgi:hypothetical protein